MIKEFREIMKANFDELEHFQTDQKRNMPNPPLSKVYEGVTIDLPEVTEKMRQKRMYFKQLQIVKVDENSQKIL